MFGWMDGWMDSMLLNDMSAADVI